MAGRDQQRWRRPLRRERSGQQLQLKLQPGPRGGCTGVVGGGPELGLGPGWPPPSPHRGTGTGRGAMAWGGGPREDRSRPERTPSTKAGRGGPSRPGGSGLEGQHPWTAGTTPPDPVANQRPRPFCPRGGRTRLKPCRGGRGAEMRVLFDLPPRHCP